MPRPGPVSGGLLCVLLLAMAPGPVADGEFPERRLVGFRASGFFDPLGDFASHTSRLCSTGGATSATLTPAGGATYYLVAPLSSDSAGTRRPTSVDPCLGSVIGTCP